MDHGTDADEPECIDEILNHATRCARRLGLVPEETHDEDIDWTQNLAESPNQSRRVVHAIWGTHRETDTTADHGNP